jgi:hypothetical protein
VWGKAVTAQRMSAQAAFCGSETYHEIYVLYKNRWDILLARIQPNTALSATPPPHINSIIHDLLLDDRPYHGPMVMHSYMDTE